MSDLLLTLDPLMLFYWDLVINSKLHNMGTVNYWVASIAPGPPPSHHSNVSSTTTKTGKTKLSSYSSAIAPPSTSPLSTSESVLLESLNQLQLKASIIASPKLTLPSRKSPRCPNVRLRLFWHQTMNKMRMLETPVQVPFYM